MKLNDLIAYIGSPYEAKTIDFEDVIYRKLDNGIELEVSGIAGNSNTCTIYVWDQRVLSGIYTVPKNKPMLKDCLGMLAFKYQNLSSRIQVERGDQII